MFNTVSKVYIVFGDEPSRSDKNIYGVFATREDAEYFVEHSEEAYYVRTLIKEHNVLGLEVTE